MNSPTLWPFSANAYRDASGRREDDEHDRFAPMFTIHETEEAYEIEGDMVRTARADISVKPHPHSVEIVCRRAIDHEAPEDEPQRCARFGSFSTRIPLTHPIDVVHAEVSFREGLLRVRAPKARHELDARRLH